MTERETPAPTDENAGRSPIAIHLIETAGLEAYMASLEASDAAWIAANGFRGKLGQSLTIPGPDGAIASVLVGWGSAADRRRTRFALGRFAADAPGGTYRLATALEPDSAEEAALAWLLARYRFERYRKASATPDAELLVPDGVNGERLGIIAEGVFFVRDLINTPASDMGPEGLEAAARKLAERDGATIEITAGDALLEAGLPLIHAVGRASAAAPRLIDIRWGDPDHPKVTLVGKGVCFDTGGLNLKPGSAMALMKKDMGGAANALGLAHMIMGLGLPVSLRVLIPAVENAVSGASFRPGDILKSRAGLTVEVNNTDAEGRLVLADALALATEETPAFIADFATLTGAARVALGPEVVPFFTDSEALTVELAEAARRTADPVWPLPLWPGYEADIEPGIADLDNAPSGSMAGAITAALFLKRFAGGEGEWVHFDLYGWTPKPKPGRPKGGEAQAIRALLTVLEQRYGASG
ncbi:MAG: leucyl aminopeptidase family protein [Pseudomonadota bacterium]